MFDFFFPSFDRDSLSLVLIFFSGLSPKSSNSSLSFWDLVEPKLLPELEFVRGESGQVITFLFLLGVMFLESLSRTLSLGFARLKSSVLSFNFELFDSITESSFFLFLAGIGNRFIASNFGELGQATTLFFAFKDCVDEGE